MTDSIYKVSRWRSVLEAPRLLVAPDLVLSKYLRASDGLFQMYVGGDPVVFTDRLEIFESVLRTQSRSFKKSTLSQKIIRQYIGDGLVSLDGEEWQRHRVALNGGFGRKHIEALGDQVVDEVRSFLSSRRDSERLDWKASARELALRIIAKLLFSTQFGPGELRILEELVGRSLRVGTLEARSEMAAFLLRCFGGKARLMRDLNRLKQTWMDRVNVRRNSYDSGKDLLDFLLSSEPTGGKFREEEILAELVTFFFAGHDTTSTTMAWLGYELGKRTELQERIRAEVRGEFGNETITFSSLCNLPLLRATIIEVLRHHSPAWVIDRESIGEQQIGSVKIDSGTNLILCIQSMHRNERYWNEPLRFQEARFLDGKPASAWMPFGAGPRQCIGQHLAMMQIQATFAYLLRDYEIRLVKRVPPRKLYSLTMQMKSSLPIDLVRL